MTGRNQGKRTARCGHPGCCKTIREGSWNFPTGLCTAHQPVADAPVRVVRPGLRKVTVALMPVCSTMAASREITLPAFPWEVP